jgi:hypothetical protein
MVNLLDISLPGRANGSVDEGLRRKTLECEVPCSACCTAVTEQFANREAMGVVVEMSGRTAGSAHPLEKSAPSSQRQAYIT